MFKNLVPTHFLILPQLTKDKRQKMKLFKKALIEFKNNKNSSKQHRPHHLGKHLVDLVLGHPLGLARDHLDNLRQTELSAVRPGHLVQHPALPRRDKLRQTEPLAAKLGLLVRLPARPRLGRLQVTELLVARQVPLVQESVPAVSLAQQQTTAQLAARPGHLAQLLRVRPKVHRLAKAPVLRPEVEQTPVGQRPVAPLLELRPQPPPVTLHLAT